MKKSQITLFIILGIVIAIIFGFLFYVVNHYGTDKSPDKLYEEFLTASNLKENVQNCLEISTKKAIALAGLQGGRLYDWQLGKVVDPQLTFYIPFNQNDSVAQDYVHGNNGAFLNTNWTAHGRFNGAYQLHGNGYVGIDDNNLFDFGTDKNFSILAWFKTNNIADQPILSKGDAYQLYINDGKVVCKIGDRIRSISVESSSSVTDGLWHSVACTINRTGNLTLYVDGSVQISKRIPSLDLSNSDKLLIGKNGSDHFDGTIDEIAIFNKTLNGRQIHTYANSPVWTYITTNEIVPFTYNLTTYNLTTYNVSYGIVAPVEGMDRFHLAAPAYPYSGPLVTNPVQTFNPSHNISNPSSVLIDYGGLLAYQNKFYPPWKQLCNSNGPNVINFSGVPYSCEVYS
ncbi:MAG TPA: LamG domain-containing protein, partial [Candidatus Nanoarchaeia archaeon]|nr:LamG domain-containing protein [Candidatus Nanoarchaeia archaeon]